MGYLFIAYVCMIMAVQHCLQFCTSFQSQMKKMLIGWVEADAIFFMVFLWSLSFFSIPCEIPLRAAEPLPALVSLIRALISASQ